MPSLLKSRNIVVCALLMILSCASSGAALEPDQLALVVNRNVPESAELARFYAKVRGVPSDRIIQLDLPATDEMPFEEYERRVAQPVRQFLEAGGLRQQVRCLVTFYGVPLRVAKRAHTGEQQAEIEHLRAELARVQRRLGESVVALERLARGVDPSFRPAQLATPDALARRADHAVRALSASIPRIEDPQRRARAKAQVDEIIRSLANPLGDAPATRSATGPSTAAASTQPHARFDPDQLRELLEHPNDPAAREGVRAIARRTAHPFAYERVLQEYIVGLDPQHSDSALDNELPLLWLPPYQRSGWQPNPLNYAFASRPDLPPVVMVMRLDAPTPELVRQLIETSIEVEGRGLSGKFVIDSRGIAAQKAQPDGAASGPAAPDAFGLFDQRLRNLAEIVRQHAKFELVYDEKPDVLPPHSVTDVALYCGWYSVAKYVPSMRFAPGAVGYHIASYELTSLRDETNTGWGRGLMNDGVIATLGPVSEPLLHAFPAPDDFFPLLMTGKLTLAEVYWRTNPLVSWKMCAVGDPLYTPFKSDAALEVEELPPRLRGVLTSDAAGAATSAPVDAPRERGR